MSTWEELFQEVQNARIEGREVNHELFKNMTKAPGERINKNGTND